MNTLGTDAAEIVLRSAVVYIALFVGLRLMGKRELGQMTVFDLVVVLLLKTRMIRTRKHVRQIRH